MARHRHKSQYAQLVATFALVAYGALMVATMKYQDRQQAALSEIRNSRAAVYRNLTWVDVQKAVKTRAMRNAADAQRADMTRRGKGITEALRQRAINQGR